MRTISFIGLAIFIVSNTAHAQSCSAFSKIKPIETQLDKYKQEYLKGDCRNVSAMVATMKSLNDAIEEVGRSCPEYTITKKPDRDYAGLEKRLRATCERAEENEKAAAAQEEANKKSKMCPQNPANCIVPVEVSRNELTVRYKIKNTCEASIAFDYDDCAKISCPRSMSLTGNSESFVLPGGQVATIKNARCR